MTNDDRSRKETAVVNQQKITLSPLDLLLFSFLLVVLVATMWCNSGTLAPYATSYSRVIALPPCDYLYNIDHYDFRATFHFLSGEPIESWGGSRVLRRILYPLLAFPFMKQWGFEVGGFFANILLHIIACGLFIRHIIRRFGLPSGRTIGALLATYPGIAYWAGLPYSYAWIVPGSLFAGMALSWLDENFTRRKAILASLFIGIIATGYDLVPFFGGALILLSLSHREYLLSLVCSAWILIPSIIVAAYFQGVHGIPFFNDNTHAYRHIIGSLLTVEAPWQMMLNFPYALMIFVLNFFASNFIALPTLSIFLALVLAESRIRPPVLLGKGIGFLAIMIGGICLFNNLVPAYEGWQLRGTRIARLYQPWFVPSLFLIAAAVCHIDRTSLGKKGLLTSIVLTLLVQTYIVFGPLLTLPGVPRIYLNFYEHIDDSKYYYQHLKEHGVRPVGFCKSKPEE